jgi:hypothetical protein
MIKPEAQSIVQMQSQLVINKQAIFESRKKNEYKNSISNFLGNKKLGCSYYFMFCC